MQTKVFQSSKCPSCGHLSADGQPGTPCPRNDGHVLLDPQVLALHPDDPMLGRILAEKYGLIGVIGQGGMGTVYLGVQHSVGREVAVKTIRRVAGAGAGAAEMRERFAREAKVIGRLTHDHLVTLFDYGEDKDGTLYLVMEYLRGQSLGARLRARGAFPPTEAVSIVCQILAAVSEAHEAGLVHRDLKPENVILVPRRDGSERVKVLDFGIAKVLGRGYDSVETVQGVVMGTPTYMAPEQAMGVGIGPKTDLYACGVILYEMLSGRAPFTGETPFAILMAHRTSAVPPLPAGLGLPPALQQALATALEKAPERRFSDATTMAAALKLAVGAAGAVDAVNAGPLPVVNRHAETAWEVPGAGSVPALPKGSTTQELAGESLSLPSGQVSFARPLPKGPLIVGLAAAGALAVGAFLLTRGQSEAPTGRTTAGVARPVGPVVIAVGGSSAPSIAPSAAPVVTAPVVTAPPASVPAPSQAPAPPPPALISAERAPVQPRRPSPRPTPSAAPASKPAVRIDEF